MKQIKYDEDTELIVKVLVEEHPDAEGNLVRTFKWIKADGEINLGSIVKPNKKIVQIKYQQKAKPLSDLFKGFLK